MIKGTSLEPVWKQFGFTHHHGIQISLLGLRSSSSSGCGEYTDLYPLIEWASSCGLSIIQLLPLNDSGPDPSPYNALSSCALHPIYLSLHHLPLLSKRLKAKLPSFSRYNHTARVMYHEVYAKKMAFLQEYVEETKEHFEEDPEFIAFRDNTPFLEAYALFKVLKEEFGDHNWQDWPAPFRDITHNKKKEIARERSHLMLFPEIIQYLCYRQLKGAHEHAKAHNVHLKGDIPILISPDSVDVWEHRELFDLSMAVCAPPDEFNKEGQYWGFPLYKWHAHHEENYRYWSDRLTFASHFYSLYRIDHAVGFFRLWAVERGGDPKDGRYIPSHETYWLEQGATILQALISASSMLPVAEDLGVVPEEVKQVILSLGMPGTRIFRWEEENDIFFPLASYTPLSLAAVSTHDTPPLRQYWDDKPKMAASFARSINLPYVSPLCEADQRHLLTLFHKEVPCHLHINLLQEYTTLFEDLRYDLASEERINTPGYVLPSNWTYRYPFSIETLVKHEGLGKLFQDLAS